MTSTVLQINFTLATLTLVGHVALIILAFVALVAYIRKENLIRQIPLFRFIGRHAVPIAFFAVLISITLTLIYSDIFGFVPCGLCWFQRAFLYPQAVILSIAWWRKDKHVFDYIIGLSVFGVIFAFYQHILQMGGTELLGCPVSAGNCAQRIVFEYGYITFPLMAATIFLFLITLAMLGKKAHQSILKEAARVVKDVIH